MKTIQKKFLNYLQEVKGILDEAKISDEKVRFLEQKISDTELLVPVVGAFSAGKSTLINSFLKTDILPTDITPETALATELRYSDDNYIEAIKKDNSIDKYEINQIQQIKSKAKEYRFLRLYLNNQKLKEIEPLILVDMPGFDSPLELHNQAILNYLSKGVYFIVLMSVEDGIINKSVLREIENITQFGRDFTFCLSKTDLKIKSEIDSIATAVKEQLEDTIDYKKDIILCNEDENDLGKILKEINNEELFYSLFIDLIKEHYFHIDSILNTKIATLESSTDKIKEAIKSLEEAFEKIQEKRDSLIEEIKEKYSDTNTNAIIEAIVKELIKDQDRLIELAIHNKEMFEREFNDIVKNRLIIELNNKLGQIGQDVIDDFTLELKNFKENVITFDEKWIDGISKILKQLLISAKAGLGKLADKHGKKNKDGEKNKDGTVYKVVTTILSITTDIINPLLEIIIVFLPEIIEFFTKNYQEKKQKEAVLRAFYNQIIPALKSKLRNELQTIMQEQTTVLIQSISQKFEEELQAKKAEINKTIQEKTNNIEQNQKQIKLLKNLQDNLQKLTTSVVER